MSLSYMFGQLSLIEQKNVVKTLFTALHQQRGYLYEADLKRFVAWVDDEYHRNKNAAQGLSAPLRPNPRKRPERPTCWDLIRGVHPREQEYPMVELVGGGD